MDEVHMYDQIKKALEDKTPGAHFWQEGWLHFAWSYSPEMNRYFFDDYGCNSFGESIDLMMRWEEYSKNKQSEFSVDEVW